MLQQSAIEQAIDSQFQHIQKQSSGLQRAILPNLPDIQTHALIISGIRRCGKSTLLLQLLKRNEKDSLYLNFD
ncbi:MAG: AAA family ATPase, partial [Endomicrobium sp.]|nr:AAA family ATPase [Endomicrobium sp.]